MKEKKIGYYGWVPFSNAFRVLNVFRYGTHSNNDNVKKGNANEEDLILMLYGVDGRG